MTHHKLIAGAVSLALATSAAVASGASAPSRTTINAVSTTQVKINRYVQDGTRWQKDTYQVRSGRHAAHRESCAR